ncbi:hypothetical protein [Acinetobacter sp. AS167]|uniref:hypothetical protein n=1 Tax=Acinetobacter sp. AS167 TaxID=3127884 RepID=UPI003016D9C4
MSYTKLNAEISKYLKNNQMIYVGTADESEQQTELRLRHYDQAKAAVFNLWIEQKKYKELISCAHGRWYPYEDFTLPLAQYFAAQQDLPHLKFLCEHEIRFRLEDTLKCLKRVKEYDVTLSNIKILEYQLHDFDPQIYHPIAELLKWRNQSLLRIDAYIKLLKDQSDIDYINIIQQLREKLMNLTFKLADLKQIKFKI